MISFFFLTTVAFSFLTSQITDKFITSLHMPTYQHNNHSWRAGRAQRGSCSALRVIIMISADCWLLWCLRLSSIQCTLCVWAALIVLTLWPPFLSSSTLLMEERPKRRRGDKRQRPSDIMNTTQSGPSANRSWLEKKSQVVRRQSAMTFFFFFIHKGNRNKYMFHLLLIWILYVFRGVYLGKTIYINTLLYEWHD